jgi:ferritin-like metal-binding protein YciE
MALFSMDVNNLKELFIAHLRGLYDGEQQMIDALPKLIEKANSPELKNALQHHLDVTRQQKSRLEQIFQSLGQKPSGESAKGMKGIISEGDTLVSDAENASVRDATIIAGAQKVEHYEIAGYGTVRTYAQQLGQPEFARILEQILSEEKDADQKLSEIAASINIEAKAA